MIRLNTSADVLLTEVNRRIARREWSKRSDEFKTAWAKFELMLLDYGATVRED